MGWRDGIRRIRDRLFPTPMERTPEQQRRVDAETRHLALYHFSTCPYCARVNRAIRLLGLEIERRDIHREPRWARELVDEGGSRQVPCLRIEADGEVTWLYESADIVTYLKRRFGDT